MSGLGVPVAADQDRLLCPDGPHGLREEHGQQHLIHPPDGEGMRRQVGHGIDRPRDQLDLLVVEYARGDHPAELPDVEEIASFRARQEAEIMGTKPSRFTG